MSPEGECPPQKTRAKWPVLVLEQLREASTQLCVPQERLPSKSSSHTTPSINDSNPHRLSPQLPTSTVSQCRPTLSANLEGQRRAASAPNCSQHSHKQRHPGQHHFKPTHQQVNPHHPASGSCLGQQPSVNTWPPTPTDDYFCPCMVTRPAQNAGALQPLSIAGMQAPSDCICAAKWCLGSCLHKSEAAGACGQASSNTGA